MKPVPTKKSVAADIQALNEAAEDHQEDHDLETSEIWIYRRRLLIYVAICLAVMTIVVSAIYYFSGYMTLMPTKMNTGRVWRTQAADRLFGLEEILSGIFIVLLAFALVFATCPMYFF
jgi:flagellar biosynthesis protein FlhB